MLAFQGQHKIGQGLPFGLGQLKRPTLSSDQDGMNAAGWVPGQTPTGPLLLNHVLAQSAGQQVWLILFVAQLDNGALHGLHAGFLQ